MLGMHPNTMLTLSVHKLLEVLRPGAACREVRHTRVFVLIFWYIRPPPSSARHFGTATARHATSYGSRASALSCGERLQNTCGLSLLSPASNPPTLSSQTLGLCHKTGSPYLASTSSKCTDAHFPPSSNSYIATRARWSTGIPTPSIPGTSSTLPTTTFHSATILRFLDNDLLLYGLGNGAHGARG